MDNVLRWDCVCDACDRAGRYHTIGQGKDSPPMRQGPNWLLMLIVVVAAVMVALWLRSVE